VTAKSIAESAEVVRRLSFPERETALTAAMVTQSREINAFSQYADTSPPLSKRLQVRFL
jgi:hypothetical protein